MEEKVNARQHIIDDQLPSMYSCNGRDDISSICAKSCRTVKATSSLRVLIAHEKLFYHMTLCLGVIIRPIQ